MGAHTFMNYAAGEDPAAAYRHLSDQSAYEDGHSGYSGTIATTHGFDIVSRTPVTLAEARLYGQRLLDYEEDGTTPKGQWAPEKWGNAGAIAVAADTDFKLRERTLLLSTDKSGYLDDSELIALAKAKLTLKPGERIISASLEKDEKTRKVTQAATEGKAVTRYLIINGSRIFGEKGGYESMSLARAAAKTLAAAGGEQYDTPHDTRFEIVGSIRRESGSALVVTESKISKRKLTVTVKIAAQKKTPKTIGWLFVGLAAS